VYERRHITDISLYFSLLYVVSMTHLSLKRAIPAADCRNAGAPVVYVLVSRAAFGITVVSTRTRSSRAAPLLSGLARTLGAPDARSSLPLYQQLQRALRQAVARGTLGPDEALPAERELAQVLTVSRITVRKALDGLVTEGLLVRRQGAGTYVAARVEKNFAQLTSFSEDMRARGRTPRNRWLKRATGSVTPEEALTLRLSPGTRVYRFHRLRFADEAPMAIERSTIVASALPSLDAVRDSLYEALERTGHRPVRALQRLRAVLLTTDQAQLLEAHAGEPGLLVERLGFLRDGQAVEISQSYYRGSSYDFVAELTAQS
jgi:GntR family transcriptional regulator